MTKKKGTAQMEKEIIKPMRITLADSGETYELDFSRDSVAFAEDRKFNTDEVAQYPVTKVPEFFYYAFRKNHRKLARSQTDAILTEIGGLTPKMLQRLLLLYNQAAMSNAVIQDDEDLEKNSKVAVEL